MNIQITPRKVLYVMLWIIGVLLAANLLGIVFKHYFDLGNNQFLIKLFDFDTEKNIPTLYSAMALAMTGMLVFFISVMHKHRNEAWFAWGVLSLIFLFLSVDEISSIHERLGYVIRESLGTTGVFFFAWIIPYGFALVLFLALYARFLFALPRHIMKLFILSGSLFVLGAIGFEMLGGWQAETYGRATLRYSLFYTCEEFLEMMGIAVFVYTLLAYVLTQNAHLRFTLNTTASLDKQ